MTENEIFERCRLEFQHRMKEFERADPWLFEERLGSVATYHETEALRAAIDLYNKLKEMTK